MGLLNNYIKVKINNMNIDYYKNLNYDCSNKTIYVNIRDCLNAKHYKTKIICDKCSKIEERTVEYIINNNYDTEEYVCGDCKSKEKSTRKCEVCGSNHNVTNYLNNGVLLCGKHKKQMLKYGEIRRTIKDPNEIRIFDNYAEFDTYDINGAINGTFLIDLDMVEFVKTHKIFKHYDGYASYKIEGVHKSMRLHRYIMGVENGDKTIFVDHINRNKSDNRKSNLRLTTQENNNRNVGMYVHNTSGYKGVSYVRNKNKYECYIHNKNKKINLGLYDKIEEAVLIREIAELILFKDSSSRYKELNNKYKSEEYNSLKTKVVSILKTKIEASGYKINI